MRDFITVKIYRPPGYEDIHPELVLDDFLETPREFEFELILEDADE